MLTDRRLWSAPLWPNFSPDVVLSIALSYGVEVDTAPLRKAAWPISTHLPFLMISATSLPNPPTLLIYHCVSGGNSTSYFTPYAKFAIGNRAFSFPTSFHIWGQHSHSLHFQPLLSYCRSSPFLFGRGYSTARCQYIPFVSSYFRALVSVL